MASYTNAKINAYQFSNIYKFIQSAWGISIRVKLPTPFLSLIAFKYTMANSIFIQLKYYPLRNHTFLQSYLGTQRPQFQYNLPFLLNTSSVAARFPQPRTSSLRNRSYAWAAGSRRHTGTPDNRKVRWSSTGSKSRLGNWWSIFPCSTFHCLCWFHSLH